MLHVYRRQYPPANAPSELFMRPNVRALQLTSGPWHARIINDYFAQEL